MNRFPVFTSPLGYWLEQYIEYRRIRGYKSPSGEDDICALDSYAAASPIATNTLTKELVEAYISSRPGEKRTTQIHRISTARCFGKYLVRCGIDAYIFPNGVLPIAKYDSIPHVFSTDEVVRLINAADSLPHRANYPRRHIVMPMMFRLIYGCGLRVSEACNLQINDVDLQTGILLVRAAKFNKDRYVPMTQGLLKRCRKYYTQIIFSSNTESPFLPSYSGGFYNRSAAGYTFRQCLAIAGIPHFDDGPTVHSLRHSFAIHNLVRWSAEGKDINALLPYLSAYMGHENLLGTERYLRMTTEMFPELREKTSTGCSWLMPEVAHHED